MRRVRSSGFVNYLWNFDSSGKFLGTKLLSVTRGRAAYQKSRTSAGADGTNCAYSEVTVFGDDLLLS